MTNRNQIYVLIGLLILLVGVYLHEEHPSTGASEVPAADTQFKPIDVQEPQLRLNLLENLKKLEYTGEHRNIFSATPPPIPVVKKAEEPGHAWVGPRQPPPPPPLQVPVQFFGDAVMKNSGRKVAFFTSGEDVLVVNEGSQFLNRFRLVRIGNDAADVEEISTGRHATLTMVQASDPPQQQ